MCCRLGSSMASSGRLLRASSVAMLALHLRQVLGAALTHEPDEQQSAIRPRYAARHGQDIQFDIKIVDSGALDRYLGMTHTARAAAASEYTSGVRCPIGHRTPVIGLAVCA